MNWTSQNNSFLWLNGFAGCGKPVLCSAVIQHTFGQHRNRADVGIAFFYFEFSDESKQDESYAVDLSEPFRVDHEARQLDEEGILEICPGLIEVLRPQNNKGEPGQSVVRIAHFSIREYLVSETIREQKAAKSSVRVMRSHRDIACICLAYLLEPGLLKANDPKIEYPLASYAGRY
ncbi:hypothetical protein BDW66DRAFT_144549 [Aspergillus desertorum]